MFTNSLIGSFPYQKRPLTQKGDKFCKECFESALQMSENMYSINDKSVIGINIDLYNGILNEEDIVKETNPFGIDGNFFPQNIQHYPLVRNKIDLLVGEDWKRRFEWTVAVMNPNAINEKNKALDEKLKEYVGMKILEENYDPQQVEKELKELE